ncbi:MBL fold metallo-hydrolase [Pseudonocardia pini]|uniref:MBL fold metallo-hydrolase n=1 Tax=Pseudonocardia pini TaxID=2758030 RepID=UPI0015F0D4AE|nr:MBL fold metallo-hydrolase [Pseudonocardia pini]
MRFLGHSTARLELGGRVVLTDPVLTPKVSLLRRMVPPLRPEDWADADLVLVSHLHGDHLHLPSLRMLRPDTRVVVPRGAGEWVRRRGVQRVEEIDVGQTIVDGGLRVTATFAEHSGHRWGPRSTRGPQAPALGHVLEADGLRIYASGDTDLFDGMGSLGDLDVALLPVWGWGPNLGEGHLDPERAAVALDLLRPRLAVPVHWGTLAVAGLTRAPAGHGANMRALLHDPPHRFAAAAARHGTTSRITIARPGQDVPLDGSRPDGPNGTPAQTHRPDGPLVPPSDGGSEGPG